MTRIFFTQSSQQKDFLLLGHMGFLEFFTATFSGGDSVLDLQPNEFLPRIESNS